MNRKSTISIIIILCLSVVLSIFTINSPTIHATSGNQANLNDILTAKDPASPDDEKTPETSPSPGEKPIEPSAESPKPSETPSIQQVEPSEMPSPEPAPTETVPRIEPSLTPEASPTPSLIPYPVETGKPSLPAEELKTRKRNRKILRERIRKFVNSAPTWKKPKVGIYVAVLKTGDPIYSKNGNLPMVPASNMKIMTSAAALALLGPTFQFETSLWGGNIDKETGRMEGNLYLRGTGDPTFMEPFTNSPTKVFTRMAKVLKKRGVKVIEGDVVGDDSAFDREFLGRGWKPRYLLYDYAAPAGALSINGNTVRLVIKNGKIKMIPNNGHIQLIPKKRKSRGGVYVKRKLGTDKVYIYGNSSRSVYRNLTINNPSKFTTSAFARILKKHGIKIAGKVRLIGSQDNDYMNETHKICYHLSVPLEKIVKEINKESDNICAQHVFKAIGYYAKGKGSCNYSNEAIREFLKNGGVNPSGLIMADGSGLSEYNRVTPRQLCETLAYMYGHPHGKTFFKSLPIAGRDGTLKYRMSGMKVNAKTGSLRGHIALSGYVRTKAKQALVFSIMTNYHSYSSGAIRHNENRLLKIIAGFGGKL